MSESFATLSELFLQVVSRNRPDLLQSKVDGVWQPISSREFRRRVARVEARLKQLGLVRGDRVALLSENSPAWAVADFACIVGGLIVAPIYPTLPAGQCEYILKDCAARLIFVSTPEQWDKVASIRGSLPDLEHVVLMQGVAPTLADLYGDGELSPDEIRRLEQQAAQAKPEDLYSILYTSGTTGNPKGVMLSHRNMCSNILASTRLIGPEDTALSFLPLSHVYERMVDYTFLYHGANIAYVPAIEDVAQAMVEVRPTVMAAVPRFFEKLYARIMDQLRGAPAPRRKIFWWAVGVGRRTFECRNQGRPVPAFLALQQRLADRLVFSRMRERMGGRLKFVISGSAPLARELAEFFLACGVLILEGYGLTETSPVLTSSLPDSMRLGSVGRPVAGVEIRIAEDGEILARGPNVMMGYYNLPEETARVMRDGWFHTGDIGSLDADGFLRITDRKKDLLKTAGGKYVAPQPIENKLKTNPYVLNVLVFGDRRKFVSALIVPNLDRLAAYAGEEGIPFQGPGELVRHPRIVAFMEKQVRDWTPDLAQFERIKKVLLLERDFSIAEGTLTPSMKVRRAIVEKHYQREIDALYQEAEGRHEAGHGAR